MSRSLDRTWYSGRDLADLPAPLAQVDVRCAFGVDLPPVFFKIRSRHKLQTRGTEVTCGAVERAPFSQLCSRPEPDSALATFSLSCDDSCRQTLRLVLSCAACFP